MEFDTAEEGVKLGGGKIEIEGEYHLEIRNAEWPKDEHGNEKVNRNGRRYINVQLTALLSVPGLSPAGSSMWHEIEIPNAEDRDVTTRNGGSMFAALLSAACSFGVGCGVFRKIKAEDGTEKIIDVATGTTKINFAGLPERLKGLQVIGRPKRRSWKGDETKGTKDGWTMEFPWGHGVSQIGDPQNVNVPMFEAALVSAGLKRYQAPVAPAAAAPANGPVAAANGTGKPTATPKQQAAPAQRQSAPVQQQTPANVAATAPAAGQFDDL
jgi:hypothetical protein